MRWYDIAACHAVSLRVCRQILSDVRPQGLARRQWRRRYRRASSQVDVVEYVVIARQSVGELDDAASWHWLVPVPRSSTSATQPFCHLQSRRYYRTHSSMTDGRLDRRTDRLSYSKCRAERFTYVATMWTDNTLLFCSTAWFICTVC